MTLDETLRAWRRDLKARLPYVRRREHRNLQRRYGELIDDLGWSAAPATQARLQVIKPADPALDGDVCFFVSQSSQPTLKPWVAAHIDHLLRAGMRVVLVLNSALTAEQVDIGETLLARLDGAFVRENTGFEFAAWAHLYEQCAASSARWSRLFLVNDNIVGPLNQAAFDRLMQRVRMSSADIVGLTETGAPVRHLQSHFLVLNGPALRHPALQQALRRILSLPSRGQMHDVYELRFTPWLTDRGLRCEALFAASPQDRQHAPDTLGRWERLIHAGLPYIDTAVLARPDGSALFEGHLPAHWRAAAD